MTAKQIGLLVMRAMQSRKLRGLKAAKPGDVSLALTDPASRRFSMRSLVESRYGSALEEGQGLKFRVGREGKDIGTVGVYVHPGAKSATLGTVMPLAPVRRVGPFAQMTFDEPARELNLGVGTHLRMLRNIRQAIPETVKKIGFVRQPFGERGRFRRSSVKLR